MVRGLHRGNRAPHAPGAHRGERLVHGEGWTLHQPRLERRQSRRCSSMGPVHAAGWRAWEKVWMCFLSTWEARG